MGQAVQQNLPLIFIVCTADSVTAVAIFNGLIYLITMNDHIFTSNNYLLTQQNSANIQMSAKLNIKIPTKPNKVYVQYIDNVKVNLHRRQEEHGCGVKYNRAILYNSCIHESQTIL